MLVWFLVCIWLHHHWRRIVFVRFGGLLAAAVCTWMGRREDTIPIAFLFSSFSAGRGERVLVDSVCCRCALGWGGWGVEWSQRGRQGRLSGEGRDVNIKHKTKDMGIRRTYPKMRKLHPFVVLCQCVEVKKRSAYSASAPERGSVNKAFWRPS